MSRTSPSAAGSTGPPTRRTSGPGSCTSRPRAWPSWRRCPSGPPSCWPSGSPTGATRRSPSSAGSCNACGPASTTAERCRPGSRPPHSNSNRPPVHPQALKRRKPMATTTPAGVRAHAKHGGGSAAEYAPMTHRQIMEAISGLLLGMFVAILSSTIVTNALPHIISDLGGGQSAYTWVVTAALLSMTAATPLWGKLADLYSKKALVQIALVIYVLGSAAAGLSQNAGMLIACRVIQGIGVGGLSALAQIVMAAMISPRERGR